MSFKPNILNSEYDVLMNNSGKKILITMIYLVGLLNGLCCIGNIKLTTNICFYWLNQGSMVIMLTTLSFVFIESVDTRRHSKRRFGLCF